MKKKKKEFKNDSNQKEEYLVLQKSRKQSPSIKMIINGCVGWSINLSKDDVKGLRANLLS